MEKRNWRSGIFDPLIPSIGLVRNDSWKVPMPHYIFFELENENNNMCLTIVALEAIEL